MDRSPTTQRPRSSSVVATRATTASRSSFRRAPGLQRLIALVEAHFASDPPWEDAPSEAVDGDFLYLTMSSDGGSDVEAFMAWHAAECGVVV